MGRHLEFSVEHGSPVQCGGLLLLKQTTDEMRRDICGCSPGWDALGKESLMCCGKMEFSHIRPV